MKVRLGQLSRRALLCALPLSFLLLFLPHSWQLSFKTHLAAPLVPLQSTLHALVSAAEEGAIYLFGGGAKELARRELEERIALLESELTRTRLRLAAAEEKLEAVSAARPHAAWPTRMADVIGADPTSWRATLLLSSGRRSGVKSNMPVIWGGFAVGKISAAGPWQSRLMLLTDPNCRIGVKSARSGARAILEGTGGPLCRLKYLGYHEDLRRGDLIVTSGSDGVFPSNYVVGTCEWVSAESGETFRSGKVRPAIPANRLQSVMVILKEPLAEFREEAP